MPARINIEQQIRKNVNVDLDDDWGLREVLKFLYHDKKWSTVEIANKIEAGRETVTRRLRENNITIRSPKRGGKLSSQKRNYPKGLFTNITHQTAYFLGLFLADGYFGESRKLKISLQKSDQQILRDISTYIFDNDYVIIKKNPTEGEQDKAKLVLYNKDYCLDVANILNISPNSTKTGKEQFVYLNPKKLTWSFIRGVFDGDGSIRVFKRNGNNKVKMTFTLASKTFLLNLQDFFNDNDIETPPKAVRKKNNAGCYELELASRSTVNRIGKKMYKNAQLKMKRKFDKFKDLRQIMA